MAERLRTFVKVLHTPTNAEPCDRAARRHAVLTPTNPLSFQPYYKQDQDLKNNLPSNTAGVTHTPELVGVGGLAHLEIKIIGPNVRSCRSVSMGESMHVDTSLENEFQTPPESPSEQILPNPTKEASEESVNGEIATVNEAGTDKWNGLQLDFSVIEDRYEIGWDHPLGSSEYGEVLKVTLAHSELR